MDTIDSRFQIPDFRIQVKECSAFEICNQESGISQKPSPAQAESIAGKSALHKID